LKKYLFILVVLSMVVMASGCTSNQNITTNNFSSGGMSFQYPDTWNVSTQTNENATQIIVASPDFISSNGTKGSVVIILKITNASASNMSETRQEFATQAQQSGQNYTNATVNIAGISASDMSYVGNDTQGNTAYARLVDFEKNNTLYLLMFATGGGVDIETVKPYFDVIVKSFKVE
jgi:uncharacterized protein YcfL